MRSHGSRTMVQEPWLHENSIRGLSNSGRVFCQTGVRARTCVIVRGLHAELVPKHTSRDLTTVRVRWTDDEGATREMLVASSYLHGQDSVPNAALKGLVADEDLRGLDLIIGCDSNSHHTLWGSGDCDNRGYDLVDFLDSSGLDFANTGWVRKQDGSHPVSSRENLQELLGAHLPDFNTNYSPGVLASTRDPGAADWRLAQRAVGFGRVKWAVNSFLPYKSPGPDGVYPVLLQKGLEALEVPLTKVFRACIALGYVPVKWRISRVAFIPKGGRVGHSVPKDYRPVTMMSFLVKNLERLVDRLMEEEMRDSPLSDAQHAYRKGRSTDTALHRVVDYIETGMRGGALCWARSLI